MFNYFVDKINDTTIVLKSDIDQYEIDQLKMSAAVSSLDSVKMRYVFHLSEPKLA